MLGFIFTVDAFREENGATRFVPTSVVDRFQISDVQQVQRLGMFTIPCKSDQSARWQHSLSYWQSD